MEIIRRIRLRAGLKAVTVARAAGIDPRTLSAIETGKVQSPRLETLYALARALNTPLEDILSEYSTSHSSRAHPAANTGFDRS